MEIHLLWANWPFKNVYSCSFIKAQIFPDMSFGLLNVSFSSSLFLEKFFVSCLACENVESSCSI